MTFQQLIFPLLFLPLSVVLYRFLPLVVRKPVLLVFSLVFIVWGSWTDLFYVACAIAFNYLTAMLFTSLQKENYRQYARLVFWTGVAANLGFLCFFKYLNGLFGSPLRVPVGVSFFTFSLLSFLADLYMGREKLPKFFDFALFVTFFPKFTSGPIVRFCDFTKQLEGMSVTRAKTERGITRYVFGLAKKVLLADALSVLFTTASTAYAPSALLAWGGALAYTFLLYFDFSGYSDMAIGIGNLFGFDLTENFTYPYVSLSVSDFWRRWHISLGAFFREYVYIPLGGNRKGDKRTVLNLLIVWLLTGIWHGSTLTFVVWGLWHFLWIAAERYPLKKLLPRIPKPIRSVCTFFIVLFGWVFFFSGTIGGAFRYIGAMFGLGAGTAPGAYAVGSALPLLIVCAIASVPLGKKLSEILESRLPQLYPYLKTLYAAVLLLLSIAAMIGSTYTSFLYAGF